MDCKWTWFGESAGLPLHNSKPSKSSPISPSKVLPAWKTDPYRHTLRGRPPSPDAIKRCRSTPYFFATLCNIFRGSIEVFRLYFVDTAEEERAGSRSTPDTLESVLTRRLRRAKKQASSQSGRLQNHSRPTRAGGVHSGGSRIGILRYRMVAIRGHTWRICVNWRRKRRQRSAVHRAKRINDGVPFTLSLLCGEQKRQNRD